MNAKVDRVGTDLTDLDAFGDQLYDGILSSFAITYVAAPVSWLNEISKRFLPEGWFATVEMADLFDHSLLSVANRSAISGFCCDARKSGKYRFDAGDRLDA
ncbi:MAG: hypothetical protein AAF066_17680 [Pseudomonadota bacterium]